MWGVVFFFAGVGVAAVWLLVLLAVVAEWDALRSERAYRELVASRLGEWAYRSGGIGDGPRPGGVSWIM